MRFRALLGGGLGPTDLGLSRVNPKANIMNYSPRHSTDNSYLVTMDIRAFMTMWVVLADVI